MQNKRNRLKRLISCLMLLSLLALPASGVQMVSRSSAAECAASGSELLLIPGGMAFGVKFCTDGVLVVGFSEDGGSPAYDAGLRINDIILSANGRELSGAGALTEIVDNSDGRDVTLLCRRDGKEFSVSVTPEKCADGTYRTGMWVRDGGAGIGTVTFIDPGTGAFGGLGHGICDSDTGKPVPLGRGMVMNVRISGITRGCAGTPGELRGYFEPEKLGAVTGNTDRGVFGLFSKLPEAYCEAIPAASPREVRSGDATILCTLDDGTIREYTVRLSDIDRSAAGGRCFSVHVTDPVLIERTGGIVQGMSGSPILQNGKLVGAVTHVLINDPTSGYGIFIENMLASMPDGLKIMQ